MTAREIGLGDGRVVSVHDTGPVALGGLTVLWHHGSPQTGRLLDPLVAAALARGIRMLSYGRPSYGGSSPNPGRSVASAAADVEQVVDALGVERFAVMGASGGGPHALACAALLPDRVLGVACFAGLAPVTDEFDWYGGMASPGGLRAAAEGRAARERFAETDVFDEASFTAADWEALRGPWRALGADASLAGSAGPDGQIDDDVAFASPWEFDLARITAPVLLVQGGEDRVVPASHADWLVRHIGSAELWLRPRDGHVSILNATTVALDWLRAINEPAA